MKHIFIINPRAGKDKENIAVRVRAFLKQRPELEALVFTTEYCGHETILVGRLCHIFEDETIRLYICGGSGTLCRAVSGIPNLAMVEVAFYPCGMTNDILKVFEGEQEPFLNLNALVCGTPMYMDLLDFGCGKALNFCSTGYDAKVSADVNGMAKISIGGTKLPYYTAIIKNTFSIIHSMFAVDIDGVDYSGRKTFITALNGVVYGGSFSPVPKASPVNGKIHFLLFDAISVFSVWTNLRNYKNGELDKIGKSIISVEGTTMKVKMPENKRMFFAADGETFEMKEQNNEFTVRNMPAALKFVVPQGVALKEQCREGQ